MTTNILIKILSATGILLAAAFGCTDPVLTGRVPNDPDLPETLVLEVADGVSMTLRLIRPGTFMMGSPPTEPGRDSDEDSRHEVTLTRPFYIGVTEVTQRQYRAITGANPSRFRGDDRPVDSVTWLEAVHFCEALGRRTGRTVALPTEAQWEYACRAGAQTRFSFGDDPADLPRFARFNPAAETSTDVPDPPGADGGTASVASLRPNPWGLHDMHGNLFEWCLDLYAYSYGTAPQTDPVGPKGGPYHVLRGGSWASPAWMCRSAYRHRFTADGRYNHLIGFRVVAAPGK